MEQRNSLTCSCKKCDDANSLLTAEKRGTSQFSQRGSEAMGMSRVGESRRHMWGLDKSDVKCDKTQLSTSRTRTHKDRSSWSNDQAILLCPWTRQTESRHFTCQSQGQA